MNGPARLLLDLLFPPRCVFCGRVLAARERDLCAQCRRTLPWLEGAVRDSLHRYKFKGRQAYHRAYGRLLAQCVRDHLADRYDLISWVPLSRERRRERGYDQAFLLCAAAALELGDVAVETLRKGRDTAVQSRLEGEARRRANVLGAYAAVEPELVRDKRVLLVDDIITTGSTFSECARVLRSAGAKEVLCAALARAR